MKEVLKIYPNTNYKIIVGDFTKSYEPDFYNNIMKQLDNLDISILVNNVGIGHGGLID